MSVQSSKNTHINIMSRNTVCGCMVIGVSVQMLWAPILYCVFKIVQIHGSLAGSDRDPDFLTTRDDQTKRNHEGERGTHMYGWAHVIATPYTWHPSCRASENPSTWGQPREEGWGPTWPTYRRPCCESANTKHRCGLQPRAATWASRVFYFFF